MWVAYRVTQVTQKEKPRTITRTIISYSYGEGERVREELMKYINKLIYKMYIPSEVENISQVENEMLLRRLKIMNENMLHRNILTFLNIEINTELRKNRTTMYVIERGYTPSFVVKFNYSTSKSEKTQYYSIAILSGNSNVFNYVYGNTYTIPLPLRGGNLINPISIYALRIVEKALRTAFYILQLSYLPSESALRYLSNGGISVNYSLKPYFIFKKIEKLLA